MVEQSTADPEIEVLDRTKIWRSRHNKKVKCYMTLQSSKAGL